MKNRKKLYIVLVIIAVGALCAIFYPKQDKQSYSEQYKEQEAIKMADFIERFNQLNPSNPIDDDTVQNYYHHGRSHDDQIVFYRDDFKITVTNSYDDRFKIVIIGLAKTDDDYKTAFKEFAKVYSPTLSEQDMDDYWNRLMDDNIHSVTFDEFECDISYGFNDKIEMIVMNGDVK